MSSQTPSSPPPPSSPSPTAVQQQHWCYHCDKRVSVETLPDHPDLVCSDCNFGFVESLPPSSSSSALSPPPSASPDYRYNHHHDVDFHAAGAGGIDEPSLGSQFLHILRMLSQVARDDRSPPPPPPPPPRAEHNDNDFLRIEIDGWDHRSDDNNINTNSNENENENENDDVEGEEDDDEEEVRSVEIEGEEEEIDDDYLVAANGRAEERRRRREVLRLHLRDFATRARSGGRNRILDWAEVLMGLEDNSVEFRFEMPETDRYIGNPGDYVDAAEYETLLQNLAEAEGRRGAPPASKSAVEALKIVEIRDDTLNSEDEKYACAICKDGMKAGDVVKEMPCGHGYHGDCIVPWLAARNSCPVCRYELPTDDADYEEERKKRLTSTAAGGGHGGGTSGLAGSSDDAF